jgi:hypothetical protein
LDRDIFGSRKKKICKRYGPIKKFMGQNEKLNKIYFMILATCLFLTTSVMEKIEIAILSEL